MKVSFFSSVEDSIYIAQRVQNKKKSWSLADWLFMVFLISNSIVVPALFWVLDHFVAGTAIFFLNSGYFIFFLMTMEKNAVEKHFRERATEIENDLLEVELTNAGVVTSCDGTNAIFPWRKIKRIEATDSSIYFFVNSSGFAVRKSGFPYKEDADQFLTLAKRRQAEANAKEIETT